MNQSDLPILPPESLKAYDHRSRKAVEDIILRIPPVTSVGQSQLPVESTATRQTDTETVYTIQSYRRFSDVTCTDSEMDAIRRLLQAKITTKLQEYEYAAFFGNTPPTVALPAEPSPPPETRQCSICHGSGRTRGRNCYGCKGSGQITKRKVK